MGLLTDWLPDYVSKTVAQQFLATGALKWWRLLASCTVPIWIDPLGGVYRDVSLFKLVQEYDMRLRTTRNEVTSITGMSWRYGKRGQKVFETPPDVFTVARVLAHAEAHARHYQKAKA